MGFTQNSTENMQTDLLVIKNIANAKKTKDLLYFVSDYKEKNQVFLKVTNLIEKKIVLTGLFR